MQYKKIGFTDVDGVLRGKYVHDSKLEKTNHIEHCDVVFGWDLNDRCYDKDSVTGWNKGFGDALLTIDKTTERTIPWENNTTLFLGDYHQDETFKHVCPRSLLKSIIAEYDKLGLVPKVGFEYEWFNFNKTDDTLQNPKDHTITKGMFGYSLSKLTERKEFSHQLLKELQAFKINVEGFHTETGPGVYEAALRYTDALEAADQATLFKLGVKEIAYQNNIIASFMAKWNADLPGCGGHIHVSLVDKDNLPVANYTQDKKIEGISEHFLSGIMEGCIPLFPLYA
ncbi:MAG: glutamine synthetase, partial [Ignavibacteriae bacterium]|nr:glutamine synthetase [Ignavibacteriota bacterium]